jgi:beta-lactam-binding protein with PASTA domain
LAAIERLVVQGGEVTETSLEVRRQGRIIASHEHMFLERGDTVTTDGDTTVLVSFAGGRLVLKPKTSIILQGPAAADDRAASGREASLPAHVPAPAEPRPLPRTALALFQEGAAKAKESSDPVAVAKSDTGEGDPATVSLAQPDQASERWSLPWIFASFGELIGVGKIGVKTKSATAAVRGTQYHVKVERDTGRSTFTVIEGQVRVQPTQARWAALTLSARQRIGVSIVEPAAPVVELASHEELDQLVAEVQALERERGIKLPALVGLDTRVAQAELLKIGILESRSRLVAYEPIAGAAQKSAHVGQVLEQRPTAGEYSTHVTLTIAGVPDLTGLSAAEAAHKLDAVGLKLGRVDRDVGGEDASSVVAVQVPEAGAGAVAGQRVALTFAPTAPLAVSTERVAHGAQQVLPDVTGTPLPVAMIALQEAGFRASVELHERADLGRSRVTSQAPLPGQMLSTETPVRLAVALPLRAGEPDMPRNEQAKGEPPVRAFELLDQALTYADRSDWRNAQKQLERARKGAGYPNITFHLADAYAHLTQWSEAREALARFEQIAGPHNPHLAEAAALRSEASTHTPVVVASRPLRAGPTGTRAPWGPVLTVAGGGVLLLAAAISYSYARVIQKDLKNSCTERDGEWDCAQKLEVRQGRGESMQLTSYILSSVGGVAVLGGALWWYLSPREHRLQPSALCTSRGCSATARFKF